MSADDIVERAMISPEFRATLRAVLRYANSVADRCEVDPENRAVSVVSVIETLSKEWLTVLDDADEICRGERS